MNLPPSNGKKSALQIADEILQLDPEFYALCQRHTGIIGTHAELWCADAWGLTLSKTVVSRGADAVATPKSPAPFRSGQTVQIKARGSDTMHVEFKPDGINWLSVVVYDFAGALPIVPWAYLFCVEKLVQLAREFESAAGRAVIPLRRISETKLRLEWSALDGCFTRHGPVGRTDTWEARQKRATEILRHRHSWSATSFTLGAQST